MTRTVRDARVLIAGATGVLGGLFAERAVAEGARHVVLWAADSRALTALADRLAVRAPRGTRIHVHAVDLADAGAIAQTAQRVRRAIDGVDILVTDTAVPRVGPFWVADSGDNIRRSMLVGSLAPQYIAREFLPDMIVGGRTETSNRAPRAARIVTVTQPGLPAGPSAGLASAPTSGTATDAAAAASLAAWGDVLRAELRAAGHGHVRVTTAVSPGFAGERTLRAGLLADRIWRAMLEGRAAPLLGGVLAHGVLGAGLGAFVPSAAGAVRGGIPALLASLGRRRAALRGEREDPARATARHQPAAPASPRPGRRGGTARVGDAAHDDAVRDDAVRDYAARDDAVVRDDTARDDVTRHDTAARGGEAGAADDAGTAATASGDDRMLGRDELEARPGESELARLTRITGSAEVAEAVLKAAIEHDARLRDLSRDADEDDDLE